MKKRAKKTPFMLVHQPVDTNWLIFYFISMVAIPSFFLDYSFPQLFKFLSLSRVEDL